MLAFLFAILRALFGGGKDGARSAQVHVSEWHIVSSLCRNDLYRMAQTIELLQSVTMMMVPQKPFLEMLK